MTLPPPTTLKAKILSPTTVWLQWTDDSLGPEQTIEDSRYYNVHYKVSLVLFLVWPLMLLFLLLIEIYLSWAGQLALGILP